MDKVWLTCPKCNQPFEIDVGFAGSVCRCLLCGSLVSVPVDHSFERPKTDRSAAPKGARFQPQLGPTPPQKQVEPSEPEELPEATITNPPPPPPNGQTQWEQPPTQNAPEQPATSKYQGPPYQPETQPHYPQSPQESFYGDPPGPPEQDLWTNPPLQPPSTPNVQSYLPAEQPAAAPQQDAQQWPAETQQEPPTADQDWSAAPTPEQQPQQPIHTPPSTPTAHARTRRKTGRVKSGSSAKRSRKRKGVRTGLVGGFIAIVVLMVILLALAVKNSINTAEPAEAADNTKTNTTTATVNVDEDVPSEEETTDNDNNTTKAPPLRQAEMLSLATSESTVLVLDAGSASGSWLPMIKDAILVDTKSQPEGNKIQIVLAAEDGPISHPDQPSESDQINRADCERFMRGVMALGDPDITAAIQSALAQKPAQLILITGRDVTMEQVRSISKMITQAPGAKFDVLAIGTQASRLASLARRNSGEYQQQSLDEFQAWYEQQP